MVVFGPVLTDDDSYGLGVVETDDEQGLRAFAAEDPVVTTGTAEYEIGRLAQGFVRPACSRALAAREPRPVDDGVPRQTSRGCVSPRPPATPNFPHTTRRSR